MTKRQVEILNIIANYIKREGISPTVREICDITGLKSTSSVHKYIKGLEDEGYIHMIKGSPRSMRVLKTHLEQI